MAENVVYLHGEPEAVGHFLRVGNTGHRQLEELLGSGRMLLDRVVLDAASVTRQHDLVNGLLASGAELILDTNIAELSSIGRFSGAVKSAPWANPKSVLTAGDMKPTANRDIIRDIARFAVRNRFNVVQAPTHVLEDSTDKLFAVDRTSTEALRRALDAEGGQHIGIDYSLTISSASMRDPAQRRALIAGLSDLPFENLWLRISGFGADATPMGVRRYIAAVMDFHRLGRPLVADGASGLVGLALAAFGTVGGLCHGVAEKERFDASSWSKPPKDGGGGGREKRLLFSGLDRLLSVKQVEELWAAPGARKLLSCGDPSCCPRGYDDTLKDPKAHYLRQRFKQVAALSKVPESRRVSHFLEKDLANAERVARQAAKLKVADEGLVKVLTSSSERLERMHAVLEPLSKTMADEQRSHAPKRRVSPSASAASSKR
jgi:hypothetical protein